MDKIQYSGTGKINRLKMYSMSFYESRDSISWNTIVDYLNILENLYLLENQEVFTFNLRSKERACKSLKRHFTDSSLVCAILSIASKILENDIRTFVIMFEVLVEWKTLSL